MDPTEDGITAKDEISGLFAVKKKPSKKQKISLTEETEKTELESNINVDIIKKTSTSTSKTATDNSSKLDYSYEESAIKSTASGNDLNSDLATAVNEYDTEFDRDHLARRKEALERNRELAAKGELDTKYRGLKGYQQFLLQGDTAKANAASDKNRVAGPVRAAANLRVTCRFDYKPDLCKDYNETGFCGFGDSCIFLHDRTEHKSSYQLEKEWEAEQKRKQIELENADALIKDTTNNSTTAKPTHCSVCSNPFVRPVKTKCSHYFCEGCVLRLQKCPTCKAALMGSFKPAAKELGR